MLGRFSLALLGSFSLALTAPTSAATATDMSRPAALASADRETPIS